MPTNDPAFDVVAQIQLEADEFSRGLVDAERRVDRFANQYETKMAKVQLTTDNLIGGFAALGTGLTLAGSRLGGVASAAAGFASALKALNLGLGPVGIGITAIALAAIALSDAFSSTDEATDKFNDKLKGVNDSLTASRNKLLDLKDAARVTSGDISPLTAEINKLQRDLNLPRELVTGLAQANVAVTAFQNEQKAADEREKRADAYTKKLKAQEKAFNDIIKPQLISLGIQREIIEGTKTQEDLIRLTNDPVTAQLKIDILNATKKVQEDELRINEQITRELKKQNDERSLFRAIRGEELANERQLMAIRNEIRSERLKPTGFSVGSRAVGAAGGFRFGPAAIGDKFGKQTEGAKLDRIATLTQTQNKLIEAQTAILRQKSELLGS